MMPSEDVLAGLANIMRAGAVSIYRDVADACGQTEVKMSVQGWDFEDEDVSLALADLDLATDLNIPSDTLYQVLYKDVARKLAKSEPPETRDKIDAEIDAAPTRSEIAQQQQAAQQQTFAQSLTKATGRYVASGAVDALKAA